MKFYEMDYGTRLAHIAIEIGAFKFNPEKPFKWASGYFMPVYNDNRLLLANPNHREYVTEGFLEIIAAQDLRPARIAGIATAGIPHGERLADTMGKPFCYVRSEKKSHGTESRIEGIPAGARLDGEQVLPVEDLVSTGGSSLDAVIALRESGAIVTDMFSIFSYALDKAFVAFNDSKVHLHPLFTYHKLIKAAQEQNAITEEQFAVLKEWRDDPFSWGAKHGFPKA